MSKCCSAKVSFPGLTDECCLTNVGATFMPCQRGSFCYIFFRRNLLKKYSGLTTTRMHYLVREGRPVGLKLTSMPFDWNNSKSTTVPLFIHIKI